MFSDYKFGIRLTTNIDGKVLITFNARNEHDRTKFVEDLKEAILEVGFAHLALMTMLNCFKLDINMTLFINSGIIE